MTTSRQDVYYRVYRNRQSWLYHLAYMRLSKVYGVLHALDASGVGLAGMRVFDYGFGAGTLFLHCPKDTRLFGIELDPDHVKRVGEILRAKGYRAELEPVDEENWRGHRMLSGSYDIVVASHVLEHLTNPPDLLRRLAQCAAPDGLVAVLLPINERVEHSGHECAIEDGTVDKWAAEAGAEVVLQFDFDPFTYYAWPVLEGRSRLARVAAQAVSLTLGVAASLIGRRAWMTLGRWCLNLPGAKPAQRAVVLRPRQLPNDRGEQETIGNS